MPRIEVTRPIMGICHMQVCADADASDEEVLAFCNRENPAGTSNGWSHIIRENAADGFWSDCDLAPKACANDPRRLHLIIAC
jgi:hypothetical protein